MPIPHRILQSCLLLVAVALLLVGLVSGTPLRHVVQVLPACAVLVAARRGRSWTAAAMVAICVFWLAIVLLIWLFLLGFDSPVKGSYSAVEIVLTLVIGLAAIVGVGAAVRLRPRPHALAFVGAFTGAAVLQIAAMWLSLRPWLEHQ